MSNVVDFLKYRKQRTNADAPELFDNPFISDGRGGVSREALQIFNDDLLDLHRYDSRKLLPPSPFG